MPREPTSPNFRYFRSFDFISIRDNWWSLPRLRRLLFRRRQVWRRFHRHLPGRRHEFFLFLLHLPFFCLLVFCVFADFSSLRRRWWGEYFLLHLFPRSLFLLSHPFVRRRHHHRGAISIHRSIVFSLMRSCVFFFFFSMMMMMMMMTTTTPLFYATHNILRSFVRAFEISDFLQQLFPRVEKLCVGQPFEIISISLPFSSFFFSHSTFFVSSSRCRRRGRRGRRG